MTYRAAMYLDQEYVDVLKTKDPLVLLQSAIDEDCLNKLVVMSDIMSSMEMSHKEVITIDKTIVHTVKRLLTLFYYVFQDC